MFFKVMAMAAAVVVLGASPGLAQVEVPATAAGPDTGTSSMGDKDGHFDYDACLQVETAGETGWGNCSEQQLVIEEQAMAVAYSDLLASAGAISPTTVENFQHMQSAWIAYRNADCAISYSLDGAMQGALEQGQCLVDMTVAQTSELRHWRDELEHPENYH